MPKKKQNERVTRKGKKVYYAAADVMYLHHPANRANPRRLEMLNKIFINLAKQSA